MVFQVNDLDGLSASGEKILQLSKPKTPLEQDLSARNDTVRELYFETNKKVYERTEQMEQVRDRCVAEIRVLEAKMAELSSMMEAAETQEIKDALYEQYLFCEEQKADLEAAAENAAEQAERACELLQELKQYRNLFDAAASHCVNIGRSFEKVADQINRLGRKLPEIAERLKDSM